MQVTRTLKYSIVNVKDNTNIERCRVSHLKTLMPTESMLFSVNAQKQADEPWLPRFWSTYMASGERKGKIYSRQIIYFTHKHCWMFLPPRKLLTLLKTSPTTPEYVVLSSLWTTVKKSLVSRCAFPPQPENGRYMVTLGENYKNELRFFCHQNYSSPITVSQCVDGLWTEMATCSSKCFKNIIFLFQM